METWTQLPKDYTIKELTSFDWVYFEDFLREAGRVEDELYGGLHSGGSKFDYSGYIISGGHIRICFYKGSPVGVMAFRLGVSVFDGSTVAHQDLLWVKSGVRTAYLLLKDFLDYGLANANHVFTQIGRHTNIKPESLKKLGFKKIEEIYGIEGIR